MWNNCQHQCLASSVQGSGLTPRRREKEKSAMTHDPNLSSPVRVEDLETKEPAIPVSAGSPSTPVPGPLHTSDAPRVDQALNSVLEHRNDPYVEPKETLSA